jgi:lipoate-protein ligase A
MALDEAAMEEGRAGRFIFRTYQWQPTCVSLGRNQPTGDMLGGVPTGDLTTGRDVVRRATGGRSVYHGPEITYSFVAPDRSLGGPRAIYRTVHLALREALESLGIKLDPPTSAAPRPGEQEGAQLRRVALNLDECFISPGPDEVTVGGRKVLGSSQWREHGAVLQHGSLLLRNEQARATVDGGGGHGAIGLLDLGVSLTRAEITHSMIESLATLLDVPAQTTEPSPATVRLAESLEARYKSAAWTWRR